MSQRSAFTLAPLALSLTLLAGVAPVWANPEAGAAQPAPEAAGNIDPAAKRLLEESAAAVKALKSASFNVKRTTSGPMNLGVEGELRWVRTAPALSFMFSGTWDLPMEDTKGGTVAVIESKRVHWIDELKKTHFDEPFNNQVQGFKWVSRMRDLAIPSFLNEAEPFTNLLRSRKIEIVEDKDVRGENCTVIRCVIEEGKSEAIIAISTVDKLPRMLSRARIEKDMRIGPTWELWNVKIDQAQAKDLAPATPEGFQNVKTETPATPAPADAPKPGAMNTSPTSPMGGLAPGSSVPAFEATTADGGKVSSSDLKGKVTVLGFWQPALGNGVNVVKALGTVSETFKGQPVQVMSVACRDGSDAASVAEFMKSYNVAVPTIASGDNVANAFNLRGFPSFVVIGSDGKILSFHESMPSADVLKKAVSSGVQQASAEPAK